jgi:hypothetical protein
MVNGLRDVGGIRSITNGGMVRVVKFGMTGELITGGFGGGAQQSLKDGVVEEPDGVVPVVLVGGSGVVVPERVVVVLVGITVSKYIYIIRSYNLHRKRCKKCWNRWKPIVLTTQPK